MVRRVREELHVYQFATFSGALASVIAVAAALQQALVRRRRQQVVLELRIAVGRLMRIRKWLVAWIASVTQDPQLATHSSGYLSFYAGISHELEQHISEVRSIDAEGSTERLRSDVEDVVRCVLRQWDWAAAMIPPERLISELRHPLGLHAAQRSAGVDLASEERKLVLHLRSVMRRLDDSQAAERIEEVLPLDPDADYDVDAMWGGDVRPFV